MIRWIPYTFVRTVLFFITGIVLGLKNPGLISENISFCLLAGMTALYFLIVFTGRKRRHSLNPGWVALSAIMLMGYIHVIRQTESRHPDHLLNSRLAVSHYQAIVTRFAEEKARSWKLEARVLRVHANGWREKEGKLVLYLSKDDFHHPFEYGDVLLIKGKPDVPEGPANPGEFDYRAFLALKNIYHRDFLREGEVLKTGHAPPNRFMAFAFRGRQWAESTLKRFIKGSREQAIASALVLGVTDGLDNQLLGAYAATGSMHILAVSGLHVSILYLLLVWILRPLDRLPWGRWFVALAALCTLWLYAFVTGLSPSVLRAVTMFSFFALARPWARSTNIYNTLAVSAFCLLLFDPFLICSVGFQLSYLAVLGIVCLYPRILALWEPQHLFTTRIWKMSAVSIAAQITTFPLGLLYFHQFPNYFLLSNLLVVPLSSVVLVSGLMVLGASFFSALAAVLGYGLQLAIRLLNAIVFTLEGLPFSVTENIYISPLQCVIMVFFIMALLALTHYRKYQYALLAFALVVAFTTLQWLHFFREIDTRKFTVYSVPGHSVIDLIDRGQAFFLADSMSAQASEKIRYHIAPNRLMAGVRRIDARPAVFRSLNGGTLIGWHGKKILLVTGRSFDVPAGLRVDWMIISHNALEDVRRIAEGIKCEKVVLDSSNSFFFASRFLQAAKLYKLDVHSVLHQGAFISQIENRDK